MKRQHRGGRGEGGGDQAAGNSNNAPMYQRVSVKKKS